MVAAGKSMMFKSYLAIILLLSPFQSDTVEFHSCA